MKYAIGAAVLALIAVVAVLVVRAEKPVASSTSTSGQRAGAAGPAPSLPNAPGKMQHGRVIVHAEWGGGAGALGARAANESNPEGPMSLIAANGGLVVLDQVNARIVRYGADGKLAGSFPIAPDTAQDIAVGRDGKVAVLDRVTDGQLLYYDENGKLIGQAPVVGGPITESGGATGVFIDGSGTYIEREHGEVVRVLDASGRPDTSRNTLPGRPLRNGAGSVQALITDKAAGIAALRVFDNQANAVWQRSVRFPASIISLLMLDSDLAGRVYIAAHIATESTSPPYGLTNERTIVWRLAGDTGAPLGAITIPAPSPETEALRPLSVGDDGVVYQLQPSSSGVEIHAYSFP
jgi:hypothetical protein